MEYLTDKYESKFEQGLKKFTLYFVSLFFTWAGARHFIKPQFYISMMPRYLPAPLTLVYISGFFEIIGGLGLIIPKFRTISAWGLMALLVAVLPANIYTWTEKVQVSDVYWIEGWNLMLRIPLQFLLISLMYMFAKNPDHY